MLRKSSAAYDPEESLRALLQQSERPPSVGVASSATPLPVKTKSNGQPSPPERQALAPHVEREEGDKNSALPLHFIPEGSPVKRGSVDIDPYLTFESELPEALSPLLHDRAVQLERVVLKFPAVHCLIRVLDIAFCKVLVVRVTTDDWRTHTDVEAKFVETSEGCHGSCQFCAILRVPRDTSRVEFAICYRVDGKEYWDNCGGKNYRVRVSQPPTTPDTRRASGLTFSPNNSLSAPTGAFTAAALAGAGSAAAAAAAAAGKPTQISAV